MAALVGVGLTAVPAAACSLLTIKPIRFQSSTCERKIRELIEFANVAHGKTDDEISDWQERKDIDPYYEGDEWESDAYLKEMRTSFGNVDPEPIKIVQLELLTQVKNKALYVFVLQRKQYVPADPEGCNGLFVHDEYYGESSTAYIASFENNRFERFREFPEWLV